MSDPIRVLLAKPTHDAHDRGVRYTARKFRDAGFEVIFTTFRQADQVVATALEEDVDVIGISSSAQGHLAVFEELFAGIEAQGLGDVLVIGGGVIPSRDHDQLRQWGLSAVFGPGSSAEAAIGHIRDNVRRR